MRASWCLTFLAMCALFSFVMCIGMEETVGIPQKFVDAFDCNNKCALPMDWASPSGFCGQDLVNYPNYLCNSTMATFAQCLTKNLAAPSPNVGVSYPGDCGCPSYCSNSTLQGDCRNGKCFCSSGWSGVDCSQVSSSNICNFQGQPAEILGFWTCQCANGFAMNDCSASVGVLPAITQTITPESQYTDWDEYGNNNPIFNDSTIAQIHLTMPPSFLEFMQSPNNSQTDQYLPVHFEFYNGVTTQVLDKVGFRLKGGASRGYVKKTWKLSFNTFDDGRKWAQQKKIELKAMQQDFSGIKEKLCDSLMYSMNIPVQRSAYSQLFVNGQSMGAYLIMENIDDQFLKSRLGNEDGALFKCTGSLEYLGKYPQSYNNSYYQPQTDMADSLEGLELLRDFIFIINELDDKDFVEQLPKAFDIDLYTRTLAFEVLTGNWDGLYNGNNYYLYYNPEIAMFQYLRHDMDMSFGMLDTFYDMISRPVYTWGDGGRGYRLINRVLANQPFKQMFTDYCYQLIESYYHLGGAFVERMEFLHLEIQPLFKRDAWRSTDFALGYEEFETMPFKGVTRQSSGLFAVTYPEVHTWGLKEFIAGRIASAKQQLDPPSLLV